MVVAEYKVAKEAFVADNLGSSIYSINAVSLVAFTSYALYTTTVYRLPRRRGFLLDYVTSVLPLLLGVTIASDRPLSYNGTILLLAALFHFVRSSPQHAPLSNGISNQSNGYGHGDRDRGRQHKSAGQWLDESDSDEEPSVPTASSREFITPIKPSQAFASAHSLSPSPSPSPIEDPFSHAHAHPPAGIQRVNKRRLSPLPSPEPHTVNILPTPDFPEVDYLTRQEYPPPNNLRSSVQHQAEGHGQGQKLPFLSIYRAHMMVMTVHCILAVDFTVFPRWQGKCEDFGTSLMDVGVGSFVFSLGLVSTRSLTANSKHNQIKAIIKALRNSFPILALGLIRVLMVKGSDYPEHVTEYGVHWNFFFTLGLLPIFGIMIRPLRSWVRWSILGLLLSVVQQMVLYSGGQAWILSPDRKGLMGQNKEGLISLPGYLAIYFIGLATGEHVQRLSIGPPERAVVSETREEHVRSHYDKRKMELVLELFGYAVAWWFSLMLCRFMGVQVSRRMANLPYVLWIAAYNALFLFGYLLLEIILPSSNSSSSSNIRIPPLLEAVNKNGLPIFLAANLLTGLVNVSMETMYASTTVGMGVLLGYSIGVCAVAWALRGIRLKI